MKSSFLAVIAAAFSLASASVIIIDTDAHLLDVDSNVQSTDCREFCADADKQCRARGLPQQLCDVVRGQCAHECLENNALPSSTLDGDDECHEKCVDESHKCRDAGTDEEECRQKFITCKDKCLQSETFDNPLLDVFESANANAFEVKNAAACMDGSCRDSCHARKHRCEQSGLPIWRCQGDFKKCYESCSAPPSELVLEMYADKGCKQRCHATEHRCRTSGMPMWRCKGDYEHCVEKC